LVKIANLNLPTSIWRPVGVIQLVFHRDVWQQKQEFLFYSMALFA